MLLTTIAILNALGLVLFVVGSVWKYTAIAAIGGVFVLGVGVVVTGTGISVVDGKTVEETGSNTTVHQQEYRQVETPQHMSAGFLMMLGGSVMFLRSLEEVS